MTTIVLKTKEKGEIKIEKPSRKKYIIHYSPTPLLFTGLVNVGFTAISEGQSTSRSGLPLLCPAVCLNTNELKVEFKAFPPINNSKLL